MIEIADIINDCKTGGYPEPEWEERGVAVRVIFYPHPEVGEVESQNVPINVPVNVPVNERQRWFLDQIIKNKRVTSSEFATHFNVTQKTAKRDILDMKQKELIEFSGSSKNGSYYLKQKAQ